MIPKNAFLFSETRKHDRSLDCLRQPVIDFLLSSCENGNPKGAIVLTRLKAAFLGWATEYLAPIYLMDPDEKIFTDLSDRVFHRVLNYVLKSPDYTSHLFQSSNPYTYKGLPILDGSSQPRLISIGTARVPCVFGIKPREASVQFPEPLSMVFKATYPGVHTSKIGTFTKGDPFLKTHWDASLNLLSADDRRKLIENEARTESLRLRLSMINHYSSTKVYGS